MSDLHTSAPEQHPPDTRALARSLRASRMPYAAIASAVGEAKSTVIRWCESARASRVRRRYQRRWQAAHPETHQEQQRQYRQRVKMEAA
jgi:DNA invertase Pin-like site-specific DNA recombinase